MTEAIHELGQLLDRLEREEITPGEYEKAQKEVVSRIIRSWRGSEPLQRYVPRLLHYCLADRVPGSAQKIVDLTHQYIVGHISTREEYVRHLRSAFAIRDERNSVPWGYGIRAKHGDDNYYFAPIIAKGMPIEPGIPHPANFKTIVEQQKEVHLEVYRGKGYSVLSEGFKKLLAGSFILPPNLPKGTTVIVTIVCIDDTGLRLCITIPSTEPMYTREMRIADGFRDLTERLDADRNLHAPIGEGEWGKRLRALVEDCLDFLNKFGDSLSDIYRASLQNELQQALSALEVERDEEAAKSAYSALVHVLRQSDPISTVFIVGSLLTATSAPVGIAEEFDNLAQELLQMAQGGETNALRMARARVWDLVDQWHNTWKTLSEEKPSEVDKTVQMQVFFDFQQTLRGLFEITDDFANKAYVLVRLESVRKLVEKVLAHTRVVSFEQGATLQRIALQATRITEEKNEEAAKENIKLLLHSLQGAYEVGIVYIADDFFKVTSAPIDFVSAVSLLMELEHKGKEISMEALEHIVDLVNQWDRKRKMLGLDIQLHGEERMQIETLLELLQTLWSLVRRTEGFATADKLWPRMEGMQRLAESILTQWGTILPEKQEPLAYLMPGLSRGISGLKRAQQEDNEHVARKAVQSLMRDLQSIPDISMAFTVEALFKVTSAPEDIMEQYKALVPLLLGYPKPAERFTRVKQHVWGLVIPWYYEWQKRGKFGYVGSEAQIQVEVLFDLFRSFSDPETVEEISSKPPLWPRLKAVHEWGEKFCDSPLFSRLSDNSKTIVGEHLEDIEYILIRREQVAEYHTLALAENLFGLAKDTLSAAAQRAREQCAIRLSPYLRNFVGQLSRRQTMEDSTYETLVERTLLEPAEDDKQAS